MYGIWGKGLSNEKNITLAFRLDLQKECDCTVRVSAAAHYKLYADGKLCFFGPERTASNRISIKTLALTGKVIVAEVTHIDVPTYAYMMRPPFFYASVKTKRATYSTHDFSCFRLRDRVQKTPRYSYQRGFCEIYDIAGGREALYLGCDMGDSLPVERVKLLPRCKKELSVPRYALHRPQSVVESGRVRVDATRPVWRDGLHALVGKKLGGFAESEWQACSTDDASRFVFIPDGKQGQYRYITLDMGRAITGFFELTVKARAAGKVYVLFDEILRDVSARGESRVDFARNACSSVFLWNLSAAGEFTLCTAEPYTARYVSVVYCETADVHFALRDVENPDVAVRLECDDDDINRIARAAAATFAQNAVDILTDCPSRERTGWLSDSYFTSVAERYFTGDNKVERAFLDNFTYGLPSFLPKGMVPMAYPADDYDNVFIPNWAMWYVLEVEKYKRLYGTDRTVRRAKRNVAGIVRYFAGFENEWGLIEDLPGWIFVEWSAANNADHVCGINIPTNMCYAAMLVAAADILGCKRLREKAARVRKAVNEHAYNGTLYADNLVRDANNVPVPSGLFTEVCQYYAFWFDCAERETHAALYDLIMEKFGPHRAPNFMPEVAPPNAMYGVYMRVDLRMREGDRQAVLDECKAYFSEMARRTGTLWENNDARASCNHGFASYCIRWLVFALTGRDML